MKLLSVKLKNCYGIPSFDHDFDFNKSNANLIYAPNGVMKTSLAKTFIQISKRLLPEEKIHNNTSTFEILFDGAPIGPDEILVIEPFIPDYEAKNISTLLVNSEKKERYDKLYKDIIDAKNKLIVELNKLSKIRKEDIESQLTKDLNCSDIFKAISFLSSENVGNIVFSEIQYKIIFDNKVLELLEGDGVKENICEYINRYNELLDKSTLFSKGIFNPVKANEVSNTLKKEKFFEAKHKVKLNGIDEIIDDHKLLEQVIEKEKEEILSDGNLKNISQKIVDGVASVKSFQELIEKFPEISVDLIDLENLKIKLWGSYYLAKKEIFSDLLSKFELSKAELINIENEALLEETLWFEAQKIFKERFHVPFSIEIENHTNAILGTKSPNVVFAFENEDGQTKKYNRGQLNSLDVLSVGERRALYLLYVIFEFKARLVSGKRTLIVIDDIADSFDYKNKYAIIEYLKEMADESNIRLLVMTHNFDFYRTFQGRVLDTAKWDNSHVAQKYGGEIKLHKGGNKDVSSPFDLWKSKFGTNDAMLVSIIPFVRNLIEYKDGSKVQDYISLTSMLHIKTDTNSIKISDLEDIVGRVVKVASIPSSYDKTQLILDKIYETAENLCNASIGDEICLENKVALSIAIRLKAEEFMWSQVSDKSEIKGSQTGHLFDRLIKENSPITPAFSEIRKILSQVNLMTPENIHINSFMYEPLMDMSNHHLIKLYGAVKGL